MADVTRSVSIIFGATDQTGSAISGVSSKMDALQGSVDNIAGPLADVANKVLAFETALGVLVAGGMAVATAKASDFGLSFAEITTLIDKPKVALSGFKEDILSYAQSSTQSLEKINGAIYEAISSGVKYEDAIKLLSETEKLSVAGKADLTATTKTLVSTLNAYGESTDQAGKYSDILFQTVKIGQTTIPELSSSLAKVTGLAASAKIPFETLSAAIAALTITGLPTSEAITGIKAALSNIIKPSNEAEKAAAALGIEFNATALETKGFDGVLQDVYRATGGNIEKMAALFGSTEALNAVMVLASDKSGKFKEALDAMSNSSGSTAEAYAKMKDEFKNVSQELVNNLDVALVKIGDEFIPGLTGVEKGLKDVFKGIATAVDQGAFDPLFAAIDKFGASLGDQLKTIGKNLPDALKNVDYTALIESVSGMGTAIGEAFKAIFNGLDLSTPEGLTQAIQKVVDGITAMTNVTTGIIDAWKPFLSMLGNAIDYFTKLDASTQSNVGQILGWAQQITTAGVAFGVLTAAISLAGSGISAFGKLGSAAVSGIDAAAASTGLMTTALKNLTIAAAAFATGWEIGKLLYDNVPIVKQWGDNLGEVVYNLVNFGDKTDETTAKAQAQAVAAQELAKKIGELAGKYTEIPDAKTTEVVANGVQEAIDKCRALGLDVKDIPNEKLIELMLGGKAGTDIAKFKSDLEGLETNDKVIDILVNADAGSIDSVVAVLKQKLPDERWQQIKAQLEESGFSEIAARMDAIVKGKTVTVGAVPDPSLGEIKEYVEYWFGQKTIEIKAKTDTSSLDDFKTKLSTLSNEQIVNIISKADKTELDDFAAAMKDKIPAQRLTEIIAALKSSGFSDAAKEIEKVIPSTKKVDVTIDPNKVLEAAKDITKAFADVEKTKIEWSAKLAIADLEEQTKRIQAAFESVNTGIKSTGEVLGGLFDLIASTNQENPLLWESRIEDWVNKEFELREKEFELQEKLINAQVESMNARTKALLNGDGLIKISADNMAPEMESLLYSFVRNLQVKVSQAGGDMLIGT